MKRDFTGDNLGQIDGYLNDASDEQSVWDNLIPFFATGLIPAITSFFSKLASSIVSFSVQNDAEPSEEELKRYYKNVAEKNEELRYRIQWIFERANNLDAEYAERGKTLQISGAEIEKELEYLIEVATPAGISDTTVGVPPEIIVSSQRNTKKEHSTENL